MTKTEKKQILDILDREWERLTMYDLTHSPSLLQYAAAVWTLLDTLPILDQLTQSADYE